MLLGIVDVRPRRLPDELRMLDGADAERDVHAPGAHEQLALVEGPARPILAGNHLAADGCGRPARTDVAERAAGAESADPHGRGEIALHEDEIARGRSVANLGAKPHVPHLAAAQQPVRGRHRVPEEIGSG